MGSSLEAPSRRVTEPDPRECSDSSDAEAGRDASTAVKLALAGMSAMGRKQKLEAGHFSLPSHRPLILERCEGTQVLGIEAGRAQRSDCCTSGNYGDCV